MKTGWTVAVLALAAAAAGWWWWQREQERPLPPPTPAAPPAAAVASPPASTPSEPLQPPPPPAAQPLTREEVPAALERFIGHKAVTDYLQLDDFPRRLVATVDNLGRPHAPVAAWPVQPSGGRFTVDESTGAPVIALDNASRYTPLVLLAETVDTAKAVDLYLRMYPLLQDEYRRLGYPKGEFNQRLLEVIALLLATPEPPQPPQVQLVEVRGPVPSTRPWVRYEFVDPGLEHLAAGQKILVRVGIVNERRLKKKLADFRDELRRQSQSR